MEPVRTRTYRAAASSSEGAILFGLRRRSNVACFGSVQTAAGRESAKEALNYSAFPAAQGCADRISGGKRLIV
jgi:hypothetical protein